MANVLVNEDSLSAIADAIREKSGEARHWKPGEMADAIERYIPGAPSGTIEITQNGEYDVSDYDTAEVSVSGGSTTLIEKSVSANGTYKASDDSADGYSKVVVSVPASAVDTGTKNITANGTNQDVVGYAKVDVAVPNTYASGDEGKVVSGGALVSQSSTTKNANGTYDTTLNNQIVVAVPNSYTASDEGKVVSNGALVSQGSDTVTANDTYDTTLINSLTVNVSGGGGSTLPKTGTFTPSARATSVSFDVGTTDTINHVIIVPTSESPLKSGGKTVVAFIGLANEYYKQIAPTSNNTGSGLLTPASDTSNKRFTQSGSTITVTPNGAGSFETISYTWFAW